ncbi:MAG: nicotinate-nucleotide--dimethylbenzimidazole phosphoribosyltransferase, partial [Pseudoflavonifractor sp.]
MNLEEAIGAIVPADRGAMALAKARWDAVAKPLGSLGLLEESIIRIAGMTGSAEVDLSRRAVVVMCADNGVVAEGVTQTGQEVTAIVTENMSSGATSVCHMAHLARAEVFPVDIGVARPVIGANIIQRNLMRGTGNIAAGPAMTRAQAVAALEVGIRLACDLKAQGYRLLATGEMGIGNTTTSSAVV